MKEMPRYRITRKEHAPYPQSSDGESRYCTRCKRPITYLYEVTDTKTGETIYPLGSDCVYIVTGLTPSAISLQWLEHEATIAREEDALELLRKTKEWLTANTDTLTALEKLADGSEHYLPIASDLLANLEKWGTLTPKQTALAQTLIAKTDQYLSYSEYREITNLGYLLNFHIRLGRYDRELLSDINTKALTWGYTVNQAQVIRKLAQRYRKQIATLSPATKNSYFVNL